ncbi:MAG: MBL fold metallo-hydrolase [Nannocystaceae bacterium]|nr:MBL fold metallo-hydrolase [Nannocystaceae bacterium]
MRSRVSEVAPDVFQISTFVPEVGFQFSQYLVRDDEPLLYHTGPRAMFGLVHAAVAEVIDPSTLRWISFSHFEADECGALEPWLQAAPAAQAACGLIGAMVSVDDQISRKARALADGEVLVTGKCRFRWISTPHFPHGWDAGHLFEETERALLCSDLFHQMGELEANTSGDIVERYAQTLAGMQQGPFAGYIPYGKHTTAGLAKLGALEPRTLLPMHGSSFTGDGAAALRGAGEVLARLLG